MQMQYNLLLNKITNLCLLSTISLICPHTLKHPPIKIPILSGPKPSHILTISPIITKNIQPVPPSTATIASNKSKGSMTNSSSKAMGRFLMKIKEIPGRWFETPNCK